MKTSPFARIQVEIFDEVREKSMLFDNQLFAPRKGEMVRIYDVDTDGDVIISGHVVKVSWGYSNQEGGATTCTVTVRDETT